MRALKVCATLALASAIGLPGQAMAQTKLVFSTYVPETFSVTTCDAFFMDEVNKRTGGKITFERYYGGALLNPVDTVPGIARGAADFGMGFPGAYNRAQYPISNIMMPYITENSAAATQAINDLYRENKDFQAEYEKQNVKLLYSIIPPAHTFWSRAPIRTAADFKGKRFRAVLAVGDAIAKFGGTPVAMGFSDGVEALSRGAVDGMANTPFDLGVTAGIYKVAKYATDGGRLGSFSVSASVINLAKWKALPPEVQKTMEEVALLIPKCFADVAQKDVQKAVDVLAAEKGVELTTFSPEEAKKIRETVGAQLWQEWVTLVTKQGYAGQKLLDRFLELIAKHEKENPTKTGFELYREKVRK